MSSESYVQQEELGPEYRDGLTGLANRGWLNDNQEEMVTQNSGQIAFVICDLDGLKTLNDTSGHVAGDELIKKAADILTYVAVNKLRKPNEDQPDDYALSPARAVRAGGDEFLLVIKGMTKDEELEKVIERMRVSFANQDVSISIGGAIHDKDAHETSGDLLKRADDNMYKDKQARNKERYDALPLRFKVAARFGEMLLNKAGVNPPRQ